MKRLAGVLVLVSASVALASLGLVGCSSGSKGATPVTGGVTLPTITIPVPVSTTPIITGPVQPPRSTCSQRDLQGPPLKMPAPRRVTARLAFKQYNARLVPSEPADRPHISAAAAWQAITKLEPLRAKSAQLLFGTFRASLPFGAHGPEQLNVHAWVLRVHRLVYAYPTDVTTFPPCIFTDAYYVIDSNTGIRLLIGY